jgi:hypothetical protein
LDDGELDEVVPLEEVAGWLHMRSEEKPVIRRLRLRAGREARSSLGAGDRASSAEKIALID